MNREELNSLSKIVVDSAFSVHKEMGPGLLESIYELCLIKEFKLRGVNIRSQYSIPLMYKGYELSKDFRIDILVEDEIIIELKTVEFVLPVHKAQIISYLKLADKRLGFLINFNVPVLKEGIQRFVNNF
ncbi:MAG: GxxExxY protein [Bacteroidales bacterium]|nr:GxxExxY protein [Bacteroidales bacterium]